MIKTKQEITKACVVLPTYNEAKNITRVLKQIFQQQKKLKNVQLQVLVVDDSSPDGTASLVKTFQKHEQNLFLLLRKEKQGLGAAYIAGMTHAMKLLRPDIIMEMDADLSHDPKDVPRLIEAILEGNDFVIGSRYVAGGSIPDDWGFKRRAFSWSANAYLRLLLTIGSVKDCTGGFRAMRVSKLKEINLQELQVKGYAFQIALLHAFKRKGAIIKEVPIAFHDRTAGQSKLGSKDVTELGFIIFPLWKASRLQRKENRRLKRNSNSDSSPQVKPITTTHRSIRSPKKSITKIKPRQTLKQNKDELRRFGRFAIVGGIGVVINTIVLYALVELSALHILFASAIATEVAIIANFFGNHFFTFKETTHDKPTKKFFKFQLVSLTTVVGTAGLLWLLTTLFGTTYLLLLNLVAIGVMFVTNYTLNSIWTWKKGSGNVLQLALVLLRGKRRDK